MIYNIEAEQGLLGSIILKPELITELEVVKSDIFDIKHETIFNAINELHKSGASIDIITIKTYLEEHKLLQQSGGYTYLAEISSLVTFGNNFKEYNEIIKNDSNKRKLLNIATQIQYNINNGNNWEEIISDINFNMNSIEGINTDKDMNEFYEETLDLLKKLKTLRNELIGYSFGKEFDWLDKAIGGIIPGKIYRIAGPSNAGKSWLAYNFIISLLHQGSNVTLFALENDEIFTLKNLIGLKGGKNTLPHIIQENDYNFDEEAVWLSQRPLRIETKYKTLSSIFRKAIKNKSDVIFIDYIQAISDEKKYHSKDEKFVDYALQIQNFANKYKIAVVDLSQVSNDVKRGGADGAGSDEFKGSSALKEATDVGIHINNGNDIDDGYLNNKIIKLTKNRLGPGVGCKVDYLLDFHKGGKWIKDI